MTGAAGGGGRKERKGGNRVFMGFRRREVGIRGGGRVGGRRFEG